MTKKGPIIGIFYQYAWYGKGQTIHSPLQLESFGQSICKKAKSLGGQSLITTLEGHKIPLCIKGGLSYMHMSKPTEQDMKDFPHVTMTSDIEWDPTVHDEEWEDIDNDFNSDSEEYLSIQKNLLLMNLMFILVYNMLNLIIFPIILILIDMYFKRNKIMILLIKIWLQTGQNQPVMGQNWIVIHPLLIWEEP